VSKKIYGVTEFVNRAVAVFPLPGHFDVRFIKPPAAANLSLAHWKNSGQNRQHLDAQRCTVVWSTNTPRSCIDVAQAQGAGHVPTHPGEHDL
jgi:hypothetical protein